jgi:DNA-binding GntR family transcriptional regulator
MRTHIPILSQIGSFCDKKNAIHPRLNDSGLRVLSLEVGEFWLALLKKAVLRGELAPGQRLLVMELASKYEVSQAPVREALERLKQDGLILSKTNKGSVVSDITLDEIKDIYALRVLIEGYAIRETMNSLVGPDELKHLEKILAEMEQATLVNDTFRLIELDMDFHSFFYQRCNNQLILDIWDKMKAKIMRFIRVTNNHYSIHDVLETHRSLLESLRSGDLDESIAKFKITLDIHENAEFYKIALNKQ